MEMEGTSRREYAEVHVNGEGATVAPINSQRNLFFAPTKQFNYPDPWQSCRRCRES